MKDLAPIESIGFGWRHHVPALRWLAAFYCNPDLLQEEQKGLKRLRGLRVQLAFYLHALPYLLAIICLGTLLFHFIGVPYSKHCLADSATGLARGLAGGLAYGLAFGLAFGLAWCIAYPRTYYLPFHLFFLLSNSPLVFRRLHPVFWDRMCFLPFPGLDRLLLEYAEANPEDGRRQIEDLITSYPSQRHAALRAKTVLVARDAGKVAHLTDLDAVLAELPEGAKGFLAQTREVREKGQAISRQQRYVDTADRPFFKHEALRMLELEIRNFQGEIGGFQEPLVSEFRKAAGAWLKLAETQLEAVAALRSREPTPQVFRAGDPVRREVEAFVPRLGIFGALESEIMTSTGCPGILLCGCRRLGKSTILRNVDGFLPAKVAMVVISMQDPDAFTSEESLVTMLGREIARSYPDAAQITPAPVNLRSFYQFLGFCNARLQEAGRRLLLAVDEFEQIDRQIGQKVMTEDLLATLRESIQNHRCITWVLAGSRHFSELPNARWSSYLVSVRTVEVQPFTMEETRLLLTEPLKHSTSPQARTALGPGVFGAHFWGEGGMARIHEQAGGWPHLVQLVAATAVDLCNVKGRNQADAALLEGALAKAVVTGDSVFAELMLYRSAEYPGAWEYLSGFRKRDCQPPPEADALRLLLKRHLLVAEAPDGQWRLLVPLMQRWLRERT